ncbi:topoisomerase II large subunit [Vibrio phage vB_VcorM_GR11A]|nr:topoisomerase II large subunit [Vibrio phage vB_VcorM_GR11A]
MAKSNYTADSIRAQSGLEVIQENISMYAGGSGSDGIFTTVREPADNCVDEALAKRNKYVRIKLLGEYRKNGFIPSECFVIDQGGGIPVEKPKGEDRTALEIVTSHVHGGGKFKGSDGYGEGSRGTHGVGIKLTNALSEFFHVYTCWKGTWWTIQYDKSKLVESTRKATKKETDALFKKVGKLKKGTVVCFRPDLKRFDKGSNLSIADVTNWVNLGAYFNSKVTFVLEYPDKKGKLVTIEKCHEDGIDAYLNERIKKLKLTPLSDKFISLRTSLLDVALAFTDGDAATVEGYTNTLYNSAGGTHLDELYKALVKALDPYKGRLTFNPTDLREGLLGIINFKIPGPKFASQTKERLSDARMKEFGAPELLEALEKYFKKNKQLAKDICQRAADMRKLKSEFAMTKKAAQKLKPKRGTGSLLPGKLAEVRGCEPHEREIFTVEGDSAGGTAKAARMNNPRYQETLALRGKILNVAKAIDQGKPNAAWDSEEVMYLLQSLGYRPDLKDPMSNLRANRLILLSDSDTDGLHINSLVLTVIAIYLPEMFERGMVYIVDAPRYYLYNRKDKRYYFGNTLKELKKEVPKGTDLTQVSYLKGWGECPAPAMRDIAFNPETRKLIKISPMSNKHAKDIRALMGADESYRKKLLGVEDAV